jgi:hypothetical protein
MSDIRPKLTSWLGREASRRGDRGDDTTGLRVARDLRDLVTYIEGCEGNDELLVRIGARWNEQDSDPPPAAEDTFLKYMLHDTFLNHMLHEASSEPRVLLKQLASAMEAL